MTIGLVRLDGLDGDGMEGTDEFVKVLAGPLGTYQ